jgi:hypothetical protein
MKYMLLIYSDAEQWAAQPADVMPGVHEDYVKYTTAIVESGEFVAGDPLQPTDTATTVRVANEERLVSDGPFAETKEWLAGYYIVDVADLDRALELAADLPGARRGFDSIEVRPIAPFMTE